MRCNKKENIKESQVIFNYISHGDNNNEVSELGCIKGFKLNLNEEEIYEIINKEEINSSIDAIILLDEFYKNKKIKIQNEKVLYIDVVYVKPNFRKNGLGTIFINDIIEYAKVSTIKYIILKAHPFVNFNYLLTNKENKRNIKYKKERLQKLYLNLGFKKLRQNSDAMYYKIV